MGQGLEACALPTIGGDDSEFDPHKKLIAKELKRSKAEELIEVPGVDVVVIDDKGQEEPVQSGTFRLIKLAEPSNLAVFFVGDSFEELSNGFYYPLLEATPVCMSNRKASKGHKGFHVLTMTAGDGDVFGIRLPDPLAEGEEGEEKMKALLDLLGTFCTFHIAEEPDFADKLVGHILQGGKKLIGHVEWATEMLSGHIAKGGDLARSKVGKAEEEVKVGEVTTIALVGAKFVTGSTVAVATAVTDGLMDTALMLGEEIKKTTQSESDKAQADSPKEGKLKRVGKAAGAASLQVFDTLTKAGDRLLEESCDETAKVVAHRYGQEAGGAAREGLSLAKDVKEAYGMLGKKAVTRLAAKGAMYTARGLIDGQPVKQNSSKSLGSKTTQAQLSSGSSPSKAWW